jgi:hemoglobin-like flavoprotein
MQPRITPDINVMTPNECRLVRQTFPLLREYEISLALLFYGKLFELDPGARKLFHNDLALQSRKLLDMLASVVEFLDNLEPLRARLSELGRKHADYGVRPEQYDTLTTALLWAIAQALGPDFDEATHDAWRHAINSVSIIMKAAAA